MSNIPIDLHTVIMECVPHEHRERMCRHIERELDRLRHAEKDELKILREVLADVRLLVKQTKPPRAVRLLVGEVQLIESDQFGKFGIMADNIGIDIPEGKIARLPLKPVDLNGKAAPLDGVPTAKVLDDPASPQGRVAVSPDGTLVDIDAPPAVDDVAQIEIDADSDLDPNNTEVITTLVTARRVAVPVGKAVTLGANVQNVTFPGADQFGVFPTTTLKK